MTRTEARQKLMRAFPGYAVCVRIEDWHYGKDNDGIKFTVCIQPYESFDSDAVEIYYGATLAEAVGQALAAASKELEIDRYFAVS